MTYTSLDYNYIKPCFDYDYDYDKRIFIFIYVTMTKLKIIMDFDYLNYVTKKQNLRNSMGRLSIKNLVKPWALGRVQKIKCGKFHTWVGGCFRSGTKSTKPSLTE